jgi:predicted glycogen debranching enzyme
MRAYHVTTRDATLVDAIFEKLDEIIDWYARGTRYGIAVDPVDGLVRSGEPGVQLTWMDAKVGDWVVTPRIGKCVEINALWYNALCTMDGFAQLLGRNPSRYRELGSRARASFERFWNAEQNYPFDVLDGPDGNDASIRPNAVFAVALPFRPFESRRERAIVDRVEHELWTPMGLRSLAPSDPAYVGHYGGSPHDRDAAYHRGTAWPFLAGAFARAYANAYGDPTRARRFIEALASRLDCYGVGTLAEIADGDPPHDARGCIAQAWSVGEVLRTWHALQDGEV